jgi:alkyl hydroperoxide reductase subunit AhpC
MPKPRFDPWKLYGALSSDEFKALDTDVTNFLQMLWNTDVEEKNGVGSFTVYLTADQLGEVISKIRVLQAMAQEWVRDQDAS